MSTPDMDTETPESAIMKTIRLLRFSPFTTSGGPTPTTPSAQQDQDPEISAPESSSPSPPPKPTRTPMGDYIVPPGEKPLTSLGIPAPGPADYMPKIDLTRNSAPHYSLVGRIKKMPPKIYPGPADYSCSKDLIWKERTMTLKAKANKTYFEEEASAATDIGPAKYNTVKPMGDGPCFSMASKYTHVDVMAGPPDETVQPVDTHGFETPGPNYRPNSGYWGRGPKKSFGNNPRVTMEDIPNAPGPGDYDIPDYPRGPSYSLSKRLSNADETTRHKKKHDPAPNAYEVGSTVGKAVAISITGRRKESLKGRMIPPPNAYTLKAAIDPNYKAATMSYRAFERTEVVEPGPTDYHVRDVTKIKSPVYTCRRRCKASFPDSLKYVTKSSLTSSPGPGKYNISSDIRNNDYPAFSMGSPAHRFKDRGPAPNQYSVEKFQKPGAARAPAFTMGRRFDSPESTRFSPGPAAYNLQTSEAGGPKFTISKRLGKPIKVGINPGPNTYKPPCCQTNKGLRTNLGIKLKSRASPYVYNGFQTNKIADPVIC